MTMGDRCVPVAGSRRQAAAAMAAGARKRKRAPTAAAAATRTGARRRNGAAGGSRSSVHLLVHTPSAADCDAAPPIEAAPPSLLAAMAWPLSKEDFLAHEFRQRAVATVAPPGSGALEARTAAAAEALCGLDLEAMLSETASERLFVWMRSQSKVRARARGTCCVSTHFRIHI